MNKLITRCAAIIGLLLLFATNLQAASSVTFYHHDALGSVIATSDQDGFMSLNEEYQPYGEKVYGTEDFSSGNEDWYTGKNYSKELDLTYFGARWYDAKQGRFLSIDLAPVSFDQVHSFNRYHYANNNPYKYVDPDGNAPRSVEFDSDGDGIPDVADDSGHGAAIHKIGDWGFQLVSNPGNRSGGGGISAAKSTSKALTTYFPSKNGFLGSTTKTTLKPGQAIDRFGGSDVSRFFSPVGTPAPMRSLPPGTASQPLRSFKVLKPIDAESGKVAPAFNQIGLGTQFRSGKQLGELLDRGFLKEIVK